MPVTPFLARS